MSDKLQVTESLVSSYDLLPVRGLKIGVHKIKTLLNYKVYEWCKKESKEPNCLPYVN